MLKVYLHTGDLEGRNPGNQLAVLDIAYAKKEYLADYVVALSTRGSGEMPPAVVSKYPRWSGSLWELTARALSQAIHRSEQPPPLAPPDRRCAYATRLCASIERATLTDRGVELGTVQIAQDAGQRGVYTAHFEEDILGGHIAHFAYGEKRLDPVDLLLRAICWALHGQETLGKRPALIVPPSMKVDGVERFHIDALAEPAKTGFQRYRGVTLPTSAAPDPMPKADEYARFLMKG